jgi:hypothetical protein
MDESGCPGAMPSATSSIQPVLSLLTVSFRCDKLPGITADFLSLRQTYFPATVHAQHRLNAILAEVKGADLRRDLRQGNRTQRRHHLNFLDKLLSIVESYDGALFGRIYIKPVGGKFDGGAVYTSAVQDTCSTLHQLLAMKDEHGILIADSRNPALNTKVSHSVFTEKFRAQGDKYPKLREMPLFGHSDNHAGIQICDLINSAILFPLACHVYCTGFVSNVHIHSNYEILRAKFGARLKDLQFRYQEPAIGQAPGRWCGGLVVADALGRKGATALFRV